MINTGDREPPTSFCKEEIASQDFGPSREPMIDKCFQLRMHRDVAVVAPKVWDVLHLSGVLAKEDVSNGVEMQGQGYLRSQRRDHDE